MSIETILLLTESVLLVLTIILLLYSIREARHRKDLLMAVGKAVKILSRTEYFTTISESISEAEEDIFGYVTGRRAGGDDERKVAIIITAIKRAVARGVNVRYILPKFHDRLYMGFIYSAAGAEVKYRPSRVIHSLRYMVVDNKTAIVGIPETINQEEMTGKGHLLPSKALADVLKQHFYSRWGNSLSFGDYFNEVLGQTKSSADELAQELDIDPRKLQRIIARDRENRQPLPPAEPTE
jgi:hypothetical protein